MDFKEIRERGLLLYEYVRGSTLYGLNTESSDIDTGGIFMEPLECLLGFYDCPEVVVDEKQDTSWYSLGKYLRLLENSNPNILESLFVPADKVLNKNPLFNLILNKRNEFVTKMCFGSFMGYAKTQLQKARSLKKKIVCPPGEKKKSVLEFYYYGTPNGDTKSFYEWLEAHGMNQKYVGLSNMDKMRCTYSAFYDWGAHLGDSGVDCYEKFELLMNKEILGEEEGFYTQLLRCAPEYDGAIKENTLRLIWERIKKPYYYRGLMNEADTTEQVRFSSIPQGERRLMEVSYDQDGYQKYCKIWREWNDFKKHHNPERFNLAKERQFDRKNCCHAARLLEMGIEIAQGKGVLVDRTEIDRDFLMNIRQGNTNYDDLMLYLEGKDEIMKRAMEESTLPEKINPDTLQSIALEMRSKFYGINRSNISGS